MDRQEVLALYDRQMRREVRPDSPGCVVERVGGVVRHVAADGDGWNGVIWSDLPAGAAEAAVAEQVAFFGGLGREFEWKTFSHDRQNGLAGRLAAAGFVAGEVETVMVAETAALSTRPELPDGVRLYPVTDPSGVDLVADVHEQAFGVGGGRRRHGMYERLAHDPEGYLPVVAMAGDLPVSSARLELNPGTDFAGLWGGGTVTGWRGRGLYRALIAHRAAVAARHGYRYLQVDASSRSRPILERLGFEAVATTVPYVHPAGRPR